MKIGENINIILGYACNYRCRHCITSSGPDKKESRLTEAEIETLCQTVRNHQPKTMLFTGGEPTLFPEIINRIVEAHPALKKTSVMITTNGWYGSNEQNVEKTLRQIKRLDAVQMSFDIFHGNESKASFVKNIASYCKKNGVAFNVTMCLSTPMDLVKAQPVLKDLEVPVIFQPVISVGRAAHNNLNFYYPNFEAEVLDKRCPSTTASYIPQKGFSSCATNLVFGKKPFDKAIHSSIESHDASDFYKDISTLTMGELAKKYNVDTSSLHPTLSHICQLCEYIHSKVGT